MQMQMNQMMQAQAASNFNIQQELQAQHQFYTAYAVQPNATPMQPMQPMQAGQFYPQGAPMLQQMGAPVVGGQAAQPVAQPGMPVIQPVPGDTEDPKYRGYSEKPTNN